MNHNEARHICGGEGEGGWGGSVDEEACDDICGCKGEGGWGGLVDDLEDHTYMCGGEWEGGIGGSVDEVDCDICRGGGGGGGGGEMPMDDASIDISELRR